MLISVKKKAVLKIKTSSEIENKLEHSFPLCKTEKTSDKVTFVWDLMDKKESAM